MGLNVKDIQLHLYRVVHDSTKSSYTFLQRHPLFSGASLVCLIIYVFLSYIYNFLVYMSPFLVCGIIFISIFWSSEKTQLRYVKKKEEKGEKQKVEPKYPKIPRNGRNVMLDKSSQNSLSRRRIFSDKKWDVYGGLGEKAKDLSAVFQNEFTKRNTQNKEDKSFEKGESSLDKTQVPKRQTLRSEPSMVDLVECGDLRRETKIEDGDDEDGDEAQEDRNKAIEWTKDDQENLMYLGISEMERNRRLESLVAKRRANKLFKGQLEKATDDKNSMATILTNRSNPLDFSNEFEDGLEIPGSAPSFLPRNPYVIPSYPSEEKPNLTREGLLREFCSQKDMPFCRHESFTLGHPFPSETKQDHGTREHYSFNSERKYSDKPAYSTFRRNNTDEGTHDWLIDQLIYTQVALNPLGNAKDTTYKEDGKYKTDVANMEDEKTENDHEKISMSDQVSESDSVPSISNFESVGVSERSGPGPRFPKPKMRLLNIPLPSTTTVTNINEAMYDSVTSIVDKREESMLLAHGRLCHTPTYSVASDLQVEVSEIGSPTSTNNDEIVENNSSNDTNSVLYDRDIDKGVSSGSEELWGASVHGTKEAQGVKGEGDNVEEVNKSNDVASSPFAPQHVDEENTAVVNSLSSKYDVPENTPTHHAINNHDNIFDHVRYHEGEIEVAQSSNSSHPLDQLPHETHLEKVQEWCNNLPANVTNEAQVMNDENNSVSIEQDNIIENSRSNEDHGTSVMRQESVDEASTYSVSSSPRSVLPEKTMADDVSLSGFDQHMNIDAQQSIMEDMAQETSNNESPHHDIMMPQTIQPFMDDTTDESHNIGFDNSQEQANSLENEESTISDNMNDEEIHNNEEQDKSMKENNENNSYHLNREEASAESSTSISEVTTLEDMDAKSRDLSDDKVSPTEITNDDKNDKSNSSNVHEELSKQIIKPIVGNQ